MKEEYREKLYRVSGMNYVQHNGKGKPPEKLDEYLQQHKGEYPPFMPLPENKVTFRLKYGGTAEWSGKGPLPKSVVEFVAENGFLPRYGDTSVPESLADDNYDDEEEDEDEWTD